MKKNLVFIGDLAPYLAESKTIRKGQFQRLLTEAERYADFELPKLHPPKSTTYMGIAMVNLALAYRLTQNDQYLRDAKRFMTAVLGYEKWGNAHLVNVDLSASWILFGLSLAFDWLKEELSEEEQTAVLDKIAHHAKIMYDHKVKTAGEDWSTAYYQNHNWINLNGLATAGYVMKAAGRDGDTYIQSAKENFARVYDYLPEDGSNYEGVVYWRYGGMWLFVYAHLLKVQEGYDYFKQCDYLSNTFYYRLFQSSPDLCQQLNYGDCHDRHSGHTPCVYYKVAAEYGDGYAQTFGNLVLDKFLTIEAENSKVKPGILPEAAFEFLWYDPTVAPKPLENLETSRYFDDLGLLSIRSSWAPDAKVFTIKCAAPGGKKQWKKGWELFYDEQIDCLSLAHHHPDNLSYLYVDGDQYLTCEDGYNRNIMADNHNVLLVDGKFADVEDVNDVYVESAKKRLAENPDMDIVHDYRGDVTKVELAGDLTYYSADTAKIYPANLEMETVSRSVFTDNLEFMVFIDRFVSKSEHQFSTIHNTNQVATSLGGNTFGYALGNQNLHYSVHSVTPLKPRQYEQTVVGVMTTQEPDQVCRSEIKTLTFETVNPCKEATVVECLVPADMTVEYHANKLILQGKKTYSLILKEGFDLHGVQSTGDLQVTVQDGHDIKVYQW